jgi:hypothetical protein
MDELKAFAKQIRRHLYPFYDSALTRLNFPSYYCSQCEKRIRHWVYHFDGLVFCQECADNKVAELEDGWGNELAGP